MEMLSEPEESDVGKQMRGEVIEQQEERALCFNTFAAG